MLYLIIILIVIAIIYMLYRLLKNYGGTISVYGNSIQYKTAHNSNERISKGAIEIISVYTLDSTENTRTYVRLGTYSKPSVSVDLWRLTEKERAHFEDYLFKLPGFNVDAYKKDTANKALKSESVVWQKTITSDYKILKTEVSKNKLSSLEQGIYIENYDTMVLWETYSDLQNYKFIKVSKASFPNPAFSSKIFSIPKPTIFGGLQLNALKTTADATQDTLKLNLPVIAFTANIKVAQPKKDLAEIATHINSYLNLKAEKETIDESSKTLEYTWQNETVKVRLYCFYSEQYQHYHKQAYLKITHNPDTTAFYTSPYSEKMTLGNHVKLLPLKVKVDLNVGYRKTENAMFTPKALKPYFKDASKSLVWVDEEQHLFGIADETYALVYNASKIKSLKLAIQNFRGSQGRNTLELYDKKETRHSLGKVNDTEVFKTYIEELNDLLPFNVSVYVYDDHY